MFHSQLSQLTKLIKKNANSLFLSRQFDFFFILTSKVLELKILFFKNLKKDV